jgi:predicted nucleic acid-binding protein
MPARYFLDTNVFVYSFDRRDRRKQRLAEKLVEQALDDHLGVISTQVAQEFLNLATGKFARRMSHTESRAYLDGVLAPLCEVFPTIALYQEALDLHTTSRYAFYDALIIAAALEAECGVLYSEDLQHGQTIRQLRIVNPFAAASTRVRS